MAVNKKNTSTSNNKKLEDDLASLINGSKPQQAKVPFKTPGTDSSLEADLMSIFRDPTWNRKLDSQRESNIAIGANWLDNRYKQEKLYNGLTSLQRKRQLEADTPAEVYESNFKGTNTKVTPKTYKNYLASVNEARESGAFDDGEDWTKWSTEKLNSTIEELTNHLNDLKQKQNAVTSLEDKKALQMELESQLQNNRIYRELDENGLKDWSNGQVYFKRPDDYDYDDSYKYQYDELLYDQIHGTGAYYKRVEDLQTDEDDEKLDAELKDLWDRLESKTLYQIPQMDESLVNREKEIKQTILGDPESEKQLKKLQDWKAKNEQVASYETGANDILAANDTTGQYGKGNIDLNDRQVIHNPDGSISTVSSFSTNIDGKEVLLPTIIDGKRVSEEEAIQHYLKTGEYLGIFDTPEEADQYADMLSKRQDWYYGWEEPEKQYALPGTTTGQRLTNMIVGPVNERKVDKIWREMQEERSAWGAMTTAQQKKYLDAIRTGQKPGMTDEGDDLISSIGRYYIFMTPKQVKTFETYYKYGTEAEALAYMEALDQTYLKQAQSMYQQISARQEASGANGWLLGLGSIATKPFTGIVGTIGSIAALFGNEEASDPNSGWYRGQGIEDAIRTGRNEAWGEAAESAFGDWAKGPAEFLNNVFYSMADMGMAMLVGSGGGAIKSRNFVQAATQFIMSSEAASATMKENLDKHRDPREAALYAIGSGAIEWITEKYSVEALLKPNVKEMLGNKGQIAKYIAKNFVAEGSEEGAADILNLGLDAALSVLYGHQNQIEDRRDEILAANPGMKPEDALNQAWIEQLEQTGLSMLAGGVSGLGMAGGNVAFNTISQQRTGKNIRTGSNVTAEGKSGLEQVIELGRGMKEGTESRALAEKLQEKTEKGKEPTNAEVGRLAQLVTLESGEQQGELVKDTIRRNVESQLTKSGVSPKYVKQYAGIITDSLTNGGTLTKENQQILAQSEAAINVWKSFNTYSEETRQLIKEVSEATKEARNTIRSIDELSNRDGGTFSVIGDEVAQSVRETKNQSEAVDNLLKRRGELISEDYAKLAKEILETEGKQNDSRFLDDAMKIRLAAMTLAPNAPKTGISTEGAQQLFDQARKEFDKAEEKRIQSYTTAKPGEGVATFNGAEYGTAAWRRATEGLNKNLRNQMGAIGEVAARMGMRVNFINDTEHESIFGQEDNETGAITINIAGRSSKTGLSHHMLVTLSHEMTHWLEQNSLEGYNQLREYVLDSLRSKGESIEKLVANTIDSHNMILGTKKSLSINQAVAEVVARSCENLLSSKAFSNEIAKTNPSLYSKIKTYVKNFMARLRNAVAGMNESLSREAIALLNETEKIAEIWLGARTEALNRKITAEPTLTLDEAMDSPVVVFSLNEFGMEELTEGQKKAILENKDIFVETGEQLLEEIHKARTQKNYQKNIFIGCITENTKRMLEREANDHNLFTHGEYIFGFSTDEIRHFDKHLKTDEDIALALFDAYKMLKINDEVTPIRYKDGRLRIKIVYNNNVLELLSITELAKEKRYATVTTIYQTLGKIESWRALDRQAMLRSIHSSTRGASSKTKLTQNRTNDKSFSVEQLDTEYQEAVESGNLERATEMLMDRMAETEGIIPFNAPHGYSGQHRDIAKLIKEGTPEAVARAAADMAQFVPENGVLIPMPPHEGTVKTDTDTMILANAISKLTGRPVVVALESDPRESRYQAKSEGRKGVTAAEMGFRQVKEIPEGTMPIFVDNVVGSGVTADAARTAMGGGITLAYAKGTQSRGIEGLKRATVTYDKDGKLIPLSQRFDRSIRNVNYSMEQLDEEYETARKAGDEDTMRRLVNEAANRAMKDSVARYDDETLIPVMHGTNEEFNIFDTSKHGGDHGTAEGFGIYLTDRPEVSEKYGKRQISGFFNAKRLAHGNEVTIKARELTDVIRATCEEQAREIAEEEGYDNWQDALRDTWISNYIYTPDYKNMNAAYRDVADQILQQTDNDNDIIREVMAGMGIREYDRAMDFYHRILTPITGIDGMWTEWKNYEDETIANIFLAFNSNQIKSADLVTYDDQGNVIPLSQRFNPENPDIRYSVAQEQTEELRNGAHPESADFSVEQIAEATGLRLDPITLQLYDDDDNEIDGVEHKITPAMIENTPVGILINMARDGAKTKAGKVKFTPTISEKTAREQKKMFADLMNMVARYKDSNLVWEISSSLMFSALKENSDPQYSTTIDFGTVCAKTQEIINVMSRVMLEKGRGLTREEVLMVYNETANANLTVPCPVCYVFSRWMGVPSLLNQMSQFQDRFVVLNSDNTINVKKTQEKATNYIREALKEYGDKEGIDKAKTSLMNRMKTQEKRRTEALNVMLSKTASLDEKREAKEKHDAAIAQMDLLTEEMREVEAYNWVTQALCKETKEGSGKYVVDPEFELTPKEVLFDLRRTGEFAKYKKNWRYRNTRGAGMGKAIMPYSGMTIGDIIYGTERKDKNKNPILTGKMGRVSDGFKNAIARIRKQNLIGGQRLQSTSDFRPEWGLDYIMAFLELQAVGSKVQMYTKVAEAVDFLASMGGDINLSIMGSGNGYHVATAEEIRKARNDAELASRMIELDEKMYVMDFSDVTGMDYNTAKGLKNKYDSVQAILVGMNDIHVRLAMMNPDIDFIIPWHSSGNTKDALSSMIASVGERLETSSDYTDTQSDAESAYRTPEQERLWDLRMKILMGKSLSKLDMREIEADKYLSKLYKRFNVEGVDPDCYKVNLGTDQAKQIFPYEYWDKSKAKKDADKNGRLFVEYCQHFGMVPRFSGVVKKNDDGTFNVIGNFAGAVYDENGEIIGYDERAMAQGYWKLLIDRAMYDNKGRYRDQKVVDVTKAKIGTLNERSELTGSDLPLKTSAMYGPNYSAQEKAAVDNTLAAIEERANIAAITAKMLEAEESQEDAKSGTQHSMEQAPDMDVQAWMAGLTPGSLQTEDERALLQAWKDKRMSISLSIKRQLDYRAKIKRLENSIDSLTPQEREDLVALRNKLQVQEEKQARLEKEMYQITSQEGFAGMMYQQNMVMRDFITGRTQDEINDTVDDMVHEVQRMAGEIAEARKDLEKLAEAEDLKQAQKALKGTQLNQNAKSLKKEYRSKMTENEIQARLAEMALKLAAGGSVEDIAESARELAYDLGRLQNGYLGGAYGDLADRLKQVTIVIGKEQRDQLNAQHSSIPNLRRQLAGSGVRVVYDPELRGAGTLEDIGPGSEIHDLIPELGEDTGNMMNNLDVFVGLVQGTLKNLEAEMLHDFDLDDAAMMIQGYALLASTELKGDPAMTTQVKRLLGLAKGEGGKAGELAERLKNAQDYLKGAIDKGEQAKGLTKMLRKDVDSAISYYNKTAAVAAKVEKQKVKEGLIAQLKSQHAQDLMKEQQKWRDLIEKDKTVRAMMQQNQDLRRGITSDYTRIRKLLVNETDQKNIPEHMKSLARYMIRLLTENDLIGRKITNVQRQDLMETLRILDAMRETDDDFTLDDLRMISDKEAQAAVAEALADLEDGIKFYNASPGSDRISNLQAFHNALDRVSEAVMAITGVIGAEQSVSFMGRRQLVADAAGAVRADLGRSRFKGELAGRGAKALRTGKRAVVYGNTTPVYFFKNLLNRGMDMIWKDMEWSENRNGLEMQRAKDFVGALAARTGYRDWSGKKMKVTLGGMSREIGIENVMELCAIWKREHTTNPEMSQHLAKGGVYIAEDEEESGKPRHERKQQRAWRVTDEEVAAMMNQLTAEQKEYMEGMVGYLSNEMSELGNETSMRMYGIKKYKEKYYFPMKVWDGVKSARSDKGITGTDENRAAHKSWSKRRMNRARNALVIGNFTTDAVNHIVEMINYNTMAPAIEDINKVLNYQFEEGANQAESTKRNLRIMFQEAYGKDALKYLETFMEDLNGGTVQDQRKTLRDQMLSVFKKNAVAGSLSVALQQPLSYIRAAMMINPKYLATSVKVGPQLKQIAEEMRKYSGVAVIKNMGRFDMNFGQSAKDYITPEGAISKGRAVYEWISDKTTMLPELMDTWTWCNMWSAVKAEQKAQNPEMDPKSEEFLQRVAERFGEVMRRTQVYDSVLVKSSNMRSQRTSLKLLTSFMAEPTLSLNVLADAVVNFNQAGGKKTFAMAGATFLTSAVFQAVVKALMGSGRSPDKKKRWEENFLNKFVASLISEADPLNLIPGFGDMVEVLKTGTLTDNAMTVLGKLYSIVKTGQKALQGEGNGPWQDLEDTVGQFFQLVSNVPTKNISRDIRAIRNWIVSDVYADRPVSGAVIKQQTIANLMSADNLIGVLNTWLGDAGYKTTNEAYYNRIWNAVKAGDEQAEDELKEFMTAARGVSEKKITEEVNKRAKADTSMSALEKAEYLNNESYVMEQYKAGEIGREDAQRLLKEADRKETDDSIWWKLDRADFEKETGEKPSGSEKYYRLDRAIEDNAPDAEIEKIAKDMIEHGADESKVNSRLKKREGAAYDSFHAALKKGDLAAVEKAEQDLISQKLVTKSGLASKRKNYFINAFEEGEITRKQAEDGLKKFTDMAEDDVFWKIDKIDWMKSTGSNREPNDKYYRLDAAILNNKAEEISRAVKDMRAHGFTKDGVDSCIQYFKKEYLNATGDRKIKLRDALTKAYKANGMTADQAIRTIDSWKTSKKKK